MILSTVGNTCHTLCSKQILSLSMSLQYSITEIVYYGGLISKGVETVTPEPGY